MSDLIQLGASMASDIRLLKKCLRVLRKGLKDNRQNRWLDGHQATAKLGIGPKVLRRMRRNGRLPATLFCGKYYYRSNDIEELPGSD